MNIIKPPRLHPKDKVGLIGISNNIYDRKERFERSIGVFEKELDLQLVLGKHALGRYHYSSGTITQRLEDFHSMVINPDIKAIQFTVGGDTAIELLDKLDYELIKAHPKIYSGLSDCTTLLDAIFAKTGLITFHGLEFSHLGYEGKAQYMLDSIRHTWFDGGGRQLKPNPAWSDWRGRYNNYHGWQGIKGTTSTGRLVGGNFNSTLQLVGTPYLPDLTGTILFLESYKQSQQTTHRLLSTLKLHGVFTQINGLIFGYCVDFDDPQQTDPDWTLGAMVSEITSEHTFPIMQIGEIGHYVENAIIPIGAIATMDAKNLSFSIDESVTV